MYPQHVRQEDRPKRPSGPGKQFDEDGLHDFLVSTINPKLNRCQSGSYSSVPPRLCGKNGIVRHTANLASFSIQHKIDWSRLINHGGTETRRRKADGST